MARRKKFFSRYQVRVDRDACIGCVACTKCDLFVMGEDMRARAVRTNVVNIGHCMEVANACPVGAIVIDPVPTQRKGL